ncbi:MAG TPA: methyl-accepting chemotaxis protein [Marinospirillum sp.]|uniref:methyl-accepting chemotaxis protein n=1 Tax=Marinospirillum sp. TaxID=2183934 RepID=UPI002B4697E3|nr:methyl-accepting chemotaxis protein [Marinospirillum sp.]HKM15819.1 methyl-accepting chemotaxis protein [Marinospirillum sp.]
MVIANLRVTHRLAIIILLSVIFLTLVIALSLFNQRNAMLEERKSQLVNLIDSSHSILQALNQKVVNGKMTLTQAQEQARWIIHQMRFGDNEYFYALNSQGVTMLHGGNPALVGVDLSKKSLPDGRFIFKMMGEVTSKGENAAEFFEYEYPRPGGEAVFLKLGYVKGFAPWGWSLGVGIYLDNLQADFRANIQRMGLLLMASLLVLALVTIPIARSIICPLQHIGQIMDEAANGNLSLRTSLTSRDELGALSRRIDTMLDRFSKLISHLTVTSGHLYTSSDQLAASAEQAGVALQHQIEETNQLSTAMNQMTVTVHEVAKSATETANAIDQVDLDAEDGNKNVVITITKIQQLATEINAAAEVIRDLETSTDEINRVLEEIQGISEQTNLLALNAAIEAARAGESGRGFAVVADEVRQLALRTRHSTEEIGRMNESLSKAARRAVGVMEQSRKTAEDSVISANQAGSELEKIVNSLDYVRKMGIQVATATEQQSHVAEAMNTSLGSISEVSQHSHQAANAVAVSSEELSRLATSLQQAINQFKT